MFLKMISQWWEPSSWIFYSSSKQEEVHLVINKALGHSVMTIMLISYWKGFNVCQEMTHHTITVHYNSHYNQFRLLPSVYCSTDTLHVSFLQSCCCSEQFGHGASSCCRRITVEGCHYKHQSCTELLYQWPLALINCVRLLWPAAAAAAGCVFSLLLLQLLKTRRS